MRPKYQFSIIINNNLTNNSAASKAVLDCRSLFSYKGYEDFSIYVPDSSNKAKYFTSILNQLFKVFIRIDKRALIGVQYPILNNVFKYFIKLAKLKSASIFCIIHDIETLRLGGKDKLQVSKEISNLNYYDCLIVHNDIMLRWLKERGVSTKMISLNLFDYLIRDCTLINNSDQLTYSIAFAGNLSKSTFIYKLEEIKHWHFNVFGPNYLQEKPAQKNVRWMGEFKPDEVVFELKGSFGLIWDGESINECDEVLGNYLKYNNPHKFSLYLAAGLPVIAPENAAIALFIKQYEVGILIKNLKDLESLNISGNEYLRLRENCKKLQKQVAEGFFFTQALEKVENTI
jgi:hypothetical protein